MKKNSDWKTMAARISNRRDREKSNVNTSVWSRCHSFFLFLSRLLKKNAWNLLKLATIWRINSNVTISLSSLWRCIPSHFFFSFSCELLMVEEKKKRPLSLETCRKYVSFLSFLREKFFGVGTAYSQRERAKKFGQLTLYAPSFPAFRFYVNFNSAAPNGPSWKSVREREDFSLLFFSRVLDFSSISSTLSNFSLSLSPFFFCLHFILPFFPKGISLLLIANICSV